MLDASWMFSDCTGGTSVHLKSRFVIMMLSGISLVCLYIMNEAVFHQILNSCLFALPYYLQDAHELFHVLTSSLEEERDRQPKVTHLFDMQSLEASCHLPTCVSPKTAHSFLLHAACLPYCLFLSSVQHLGTHIQSRSKLCLLNLCKISAGLRMCLKSGSAPSVILCYGFILYQSLPDQDEKTMTCRSRGENTKEL